MVRKRNDAQPLAYADGRESEGEGRRLNAEGCPLIVLKNKGIKAI